MAHYYVYNIDASLFHFLSTISLLLLPVISKWLLHVHMHRKELHCEIENQINFFFGN